MRNIFLLRYNSTDAEAAQIIGVSLRTFAGWKASKPEFLHAIREGREGADQQVGKKLYDKAVGYTEIREVIETKDGEERVRRKKVYIEPDQRSIEFWLTNRQKDVWKHRTQADNNTNLNVNPIDGLLAALDGQTEGVPKANGRSDS